MDENIIQNQQETELEETVVSEEEIACEKNADFEETEDDISTPSNNEQGQQVSVEPKKNNAALISVVVAVIVLILGVSGYFIWKKAVSKNPYNEMGYTNVTGRTIGDIARESGMSFEEFKAQYALPEDMKENTEEAAAAYNIPFWKIAELNGRDVDVLKAELGLGDDVNENTPWGEAEGKVTVANYVGAENVDAFKAEYGLGDEVTGDTLWKDVRESVAKKKSAEEVMAESLGSFKYIKNPYNELGYINYNGRTIQQVADAAGMELSDFLAEYSLPADLPPDTMEEAAYNSIPIGVYSENVYNMDFATFKEAFQLGDDVDENTPFYVAEGKIKLSFIMSDEELAEYKQQYGLGDDVTGDTLYEEIRPIIEKYNYELQLEYEAAAKETVADRAAKEGISTEEYLAKWGLDTKEGITGETLLFDAVEEMPLEKYAEYNGTTVEALREENGFIEDLPEGITFSEAIYYVTIETAAGMIGITYEEYIETYACGLTEADLPRDMLMVDAMPKIEAAYYALVAANEADTSADADMQ